MKASIFLTLFHGLLIANGAGAVTIGSEGTNGGDLCEARILEIRDDIMKWITEERGAERLTLSPRFTPDQYVGKMRESLAMATVTCIEKSPYVGNSEKTCINFWTSTGARIVCGLDRFSSMSNSGQYLLIHHEYAGLAGLETTVGETSNYELSNQIGKILERSSSKRLAVSPNTTTLQAPDSYLRDTVAWSFLEIASDQILPMSCDHSKIDKTLQVSQGRSYSFIYSGDSAACKRTNSQSYPYWLRPVSFNLQTNYLAHPQIRQPANQKLSSRAVTKFSGTITYPGFFRIQKSQVKEVAERFWKIVQPSTEPETRVLSDSPAGIVVELSHREVGNAGFTLTVEIEYLDNARPALTANYGFNTKK